jgi:acyl dehydratase
MTVRSFDDVAPNDELPALRRVVTRDDVKAYADVSGDQNPLHQDDGFAQVVGFEGIIAHGMFTMAHMAACVTTWAGDGSIVTDISAQFRSPVSMDDELIAGGHVRSVDPVERTATLALWVRVDRGGEQEWPIKRGEAVVTLA